MQSVLLYIKWKVNFNVITVQEWNQKLFNVITRMRWKVILMLLQEGMKSYIKSYYKIEWNDHYISSLIGI